MKLFQAKYLILICTLILAVTSAGSASAQSQPNPPGKLVDLGGHHLHVNCTGKGSLTVVVENGFGDFSFDWILVQSQVSRFTRICTYDRAGYAWSDPGPMPRTLTQINLELQDALKKLGEHGPFVLVGHSFGGPVVRNFALTYPKDVAGGGGMVLPWAPDRIKIALPQNVYLWSSLTASTKTETATLGSSSARNGERRK